METFKGSPQDPAFQEWLRRVTRNRRNVIVIASDEISCFEAKVTLNQRSRDVPYYSNTVDNMKKALAHIMTCERNQKCRQIFHDLIVQP